MFISSLLADEWFTYLDKPTVGKIGGIQQWINIKIGLESEVRALYSCFCIPDTIPNPFISLTQGRIVSRIMVNPCVNALNETVSPIARKKIKISIQHGTQNIQCHCEIRFNPFGFFHRGIRLLLVTMRIITKGRVVTCILRYDDSWMAGLIFGWFCKLSLLGWWACYQRFGQDI